MSDIATAAPPAATSQFHDTAQQRDAVQFGVWLFLVTEVMLFAGPFTAYGVYRWMYPEAFAAASRHLDLWLGTINTLVLIGSSLTMALAHRAAEDEAASRRTLFLALTLVLGSAFLGIKGLEYQHKFDERLIPGSNFAWQTAMDESAEAEGTEQAVELFFALYFVLTGVHAVHMLLGIVVLLLLVALSIRKHLSATFVSGVGLYWHFVDIVWIFLFPMLYLIGGLA